MAHPHVPPPPHALFLLTSQEKAGEILAANPLVDRADRKTLLAVASLHWRDELTAEQRREYKGRAKGGWLGWVGWRG